MKGNLRKARHFTTVPNETAQCKDLSLQAKGLLTLLLSFPDNWHFRFEHIATLSTNGESATRSAMRELTSKGYLAKTPQRDEATGAFSGWDWVIFDSIDRCKNPSCGFSTGRETHTVDSSKDNIKTYSNKTYSIKTYKDKHTSFDNDAQPENLETVSSSQENPTQQMITPSEEITLALRTNSETPTLRNDTLSRRPDFSAMLAIYNTHRGALPEASALNGKRKTMLQKLHKEFNGKAADLLRDATLCVANDQFWVERRYNIDNLLPKVLEKAEKWRSTGKADKAEVRMVNRFQEMQEIFERNER